MPEDHVLEEITKLSDILLEETKESVYDVMEGDDYLTRLKQDLAIQSGHVQILENLTIPTSEQLQLEKALIDVKEEVG